MWCSATGNDVEVDGWTTEELAAVGPLPQLRGARGTAGEANQAVDLQGAEPKPMA